MRRENQNIWDGTVWSQSGVEGLRGGMESGNDLISEVTVGTKALNWSKASRRREKQSWEECSDGAGAGERCNLDWLKRSLEKTWTGLILLCHWAGLSDLLR